MSKATDGAANRAMASRIAEIAAELLSLIPPGGSIEVVIQPGAIWRPGQIGGAGMQPQTIFIVRPAVQMKLAVQHGEAGSAAAGKPVGGQAGG